MRLNTIGVLIGAAALAHHTFADPCMPGFRITTYATAQSPITVCFAPDGTLWVGRNAFPSVSVTRVPPGGGTGVSFGNALLDPDAVAVDLDGVVSGVPGMVLAGGNAGGSITQIWAIRPDGSTFTLFEFQGGDAEFLCFDAMGRLLISTSREGIFATSSQLQTPTLLCNPPSHPHGLAIATDGRIFSADDSGRIRVHSSNGLLLNDNFVQLAGAGIGLSFAPGGIWGANLWVFEQTNGRFLEVTPNGTTRELGSGFDHSPVPATFGPDGALYVAQVDLNSILRIYPCPDTNCDGVIDLADLTVLLSNFGRADDPGYRFGDLDHDGSVDLVDLTTLLSHFGLPC